MSNIRLKLQDVAIGNKAGTLETGAIALDNSIGFSVAFDCTESSLTNKTFNSVSLNSFSVTSHGYETGLKVRFTTSGSLPTGLSLLTDYYLIKISADTLMVASSQVNALNGEFLTISGGSGTHTISVQSFSGAYLLLEASLDGEKWIELQDSYRKITSKTQMIEHETAFYHYVNVKIIIDSGQYNFYSKIMLKGF